MESDRGQQRHPPNIAGNCGDMGEDSTLYICYFDAIDPENLATYAVDSFVDDLGRPTPRLNPEETTMVNFDTWRWVDGDIPRDGEQELERMAVPDQWIEATGTVSGIEWNMGDAGPSSQAVLAAVRRGSAPGRCQSADGHEGRVLIRLVAREPACVWPIAWTCIVG